MLGEGLCSQKAAEGLGREEERQELREGVCLGTGWWWVMLRQRGRRRRARQSWWGALRRLSWWGAEILRG